MKRFLLATLLLSFSVTSHAALYQLSWDGSPLAITDTATFTSGITPGAYGWQAGQHFLHTHQQLTVAGRTIFVPINWGPQWLDLDGTNSLSYTGYDWADARTQVWHTVTATPLVGPVPEPSTMFLALAGVLGAMGWRRVM